MYNRDMLRDFEIIRFQTGNQTGNSKFVAASAAPGHSQRQPQNNTGRWSPKELFRN